MVLLLELYVVGLKSHVLELVVDMEDADALDEVLVLALKVVGLSVQVLVDVEDAETLLVVEAELNLEVDEAL